MARALFNEFAVALGRDLRFMDVGRDALAVLIGNDWLEARTSEEQRRLDDPEDYVRREIEAALRRNISITPVLLNGAQMPRAEQLPDAIREFAYYSGFALEPSCWADDVRELCKRLGLAGHPNAESVFDAAVSPQWVPSAVVSAPVRPAVSQIRVEPRPGQWRRLAMAGGVMLAIAMAGAYLYVDGAEQNTPRAASVLAKAPVTETLPAEARVAELPTVDAQRVETHIPEAPPAEEVLAEAPLPAARLIVETGATTPPAELAPAVATPQKAPPAEAPAEAPPADAPLPELASADATPHKAPPVEAPTDAPRADPSFPETPRLEARLTEATLTKSLPADIPLAEPPLPEVPLARMPPAELQLSEVLLDDAQLAEVRPREQRALNMNSRITLRSPDNRYVVNARSRENYYYASLGSIAQVMALEAGDSPLVDGSLVTIKTTENWGGEWADRTYLGAFGDRTELYYWDYYGAKTQWIIEKASAQRGDRIYSGDKVTIQNARFTGQYLTTHPDNYLTTTNRTPRAEWTIELAN